MNKIAVFKKKIIFVLFMLKKLNSYLMYTFEIIREEMLTSLTNKVERKFV